MHLGEIVKKKDKKILIYEPGLHYKLPFLDTVKKIDSKIQTTAHRSHIFISKGKKDFIIDFYIKWTINDFRRYYLLTQNNDNYHIEILLKHKFNDILYSEIEKLNKNHHSINKINSFNRKMYEKCDFYPLIIRNIFLKSSFPYQNFNFLTKKNVQEKNVSFVALMNKSSFIDLGINVIDISIKKITLSTEVLNDIYHRMTLDNELFSRNEILKGQMIAKKMKLQADYKVIKILSDAKKKGLVIRGESEAIFMRLLSSIFIKEPNFYRFFQTF